jgi:hypothetical protein
MLFCPVDGQPLPDGTKVCRYCGTEIMPGWDFIIYRQKNNRMFPLTEETPEFNNHDFDAAIARWNADVGGLHWIEDLVNEQKAICLIPASYPGFYTAQTKYILPFIQDKPPFVKEDWTWKGDEHETHPMFKKSENVVLLCHPDEWLVIEVWDAS